ncbi:MAG: hypothetical protein R3E98_01515 [Gemmatimonadota bacterium]|nr:hypothetical protein [Gemmatimonadota bacterium]
MRGLAGLPKLGGPFLVSRTPAPMATPDSTAPAPGAARARFRRTLVRVLAVQVVTLALLWLLQTAYGS